MLKNIERSLTDLLGEDYMRAVCAARSALTGEDEAQLLRLADERVAFCPADYAARQEALTVREGSGYIKWARGELPFRAGECVLAEGLEEYDLYGEGEFLVTILK